MIDNIIELGRRADEEADQMKNNQIYADRDAQDAQVITIHPTGSKIARILKYIGSTHLAIEEMELSQKMLQDQDLTTVLRGAQFETTVILKEMLDDMQEDLRRLRLENDTS